MMLKPVSFYEAANYSPWPKRLARLSNWSKKERSSNEILHEYNEFWYKSSLTRWHEYADLNQNGCRATQFFRILDKVILEEMIKNVEIYGITKDEHLISINQELFIANWSVVNSLYDNLLTEVIENYINKYQISSLVELGCGNGKNVFRLYEKLPITSFTGGDICFNAVKLCNEIKDKCNLPGNFQLFDYYQKSSIAELVPNLKEKYLIFTSHSIEQIQVKETNFVDQILKLTNKPEIIIHFEPIVDHNATSFTSQLNTVYAQLNLYNADLYNELKIKENMGLIEIVEFQPQVLGISAFNPTSILAWKCI